MIQRRIVLAFTAVSLAAIALTASFKLPTKLIWNASASVPIGLYTVRPAGLLHVGELVVATPPEQLAGFLAGRDYLPKGVLLLKHILALPGQTICRIGDSIRIDGIPVGQALPRDRRGRALPDWQGCRVIPDDEVFLMNRQPEDSLDGRYFGPLPAATIAGRADPLWTNDRN